MCLRRSLRSENERLSGDCVSTSVSDAVSANKTSDFHEIPCSCSVRMLCSENVRMAGRALPGGTTEVRFVTDYSSCGVQRN